jgi:hypothetical protein
VYLNSATVTLVIVYGRVTVCVYLNAATVTNINIYRTGPVCVYLNPATVILVNIYRTGPVCVSLALLQLHWLISIKQDRMCVLERCYSHTG